MLIKRKKTDKFLISLVLVFIFFLFFLLSITPGLKGDLEQSLRIFFKQPVLLKSKPVKDNIIFDYSSKIFYAFQNRLFNTNSFESIKIDIRFSELEKLREDRKKALKLRQLDKPQKVRIRIVHQGKEYPATARLKGDLAEHWGNIKQWSLRIKLRNKKTIFSMNEFSISVFTERDFPYNFVISETFRKYDVLSPRFKTIKVNFNGDDWGLMLLEEQFHDSFYAFNKIKEAPIFKMTNEEDFLINTIAVKNTENLEDISRWQGKLETKIFNENEILKKTNIPDKQTNNSLFSIFKTLQEVTVLEDERYISNLNEYVDIKSFARASIITAIFGDTHSVLPLNSRYYLNPYDLKVRPILSDTMHSEIDKNFFLKHNLFYRNIFELKEFQNEFFRVLNEIHSNFNEIENNFKLACQGFGKNCSNLVELDTLKKNILFLKSIKKEIFTPKDFNNTKRLTTKNFDTKNDQNLNKKKIHFRIFDNGEIKIDNLTSEKILITNIKLNVQKNCETNCTNQEMSVPLNLILKPSSHQHLKSEKIKINPKNIFGNFVEIKYFDENNYGYSLFERVEKISLNKKNFFKSSITELNQNLTLVNKNYVLKSGIYEIKKPIIIPSGFNLNIEAGSVLKMHKDTYIMVKNGLVNFSGKVDQPIIIEPSDKRHKWKGIYVNSKMIDKDISFFDHVKVSDYSFFDNDKIQLTGGVNLINGHFNLKNSQFKSSLAEDAINLVNSKFELKNLFFFNVNSDAIDIDFGEGQIINSNFKKISGDAIDLSGSNILIRDIAVSEVADKAISVGEESFLNIENLNISDSRIGIASKDSSKVEGKKIRISNCGLYDFAVYQKKSYFSGAYLKVQAETNCKKSIVQKGSELFLNNKKLVDQTFNVKKLYDGTL